jgi:exfoliative toxin A/B
MNIIKNLPIPISGLILATLSLGNLLQDIHPYFRYAFGTIGSIILILMILKIVIYPQSIREDFKNPIIVSSSGTFSMSLMILSTYLIPFMPSIAYAVWIIGIALHILLVIYFTYHFVIRKFDISTVYPSYWIVYVGITMGAITAHFHGLQEIDFIFFISGFMGMLATLPLIAYREFIYKQIPEQNKPLTCIFTALFSILIFGYLNSAQNISSEFVFALYSMACLFYIFSFYKLISYRNLKFYPSFSAFTFPFVISGLATRGVISKIGSDIILSGVLTFQTIIATAAVLYVMVKYIKFLSRNEST